MIGLEFNTVHMDISECIVPEIMQPEFVNVYHNGELIFKNKINFENKSGEVSFDLGSSKERFDEIFESSMRYVPFTFEFLANSKIGGFRIQYGKGMCTGPLAFRDKFLFWCWLF